MTAEKLNIINANFRNMVLGNIQNNLYRMKGEELDKIKKIKMTKEDKAVLDIWAVCIDFNHPDTQKIMTYYYCGGEIFTITTP